MLRRSRVCRYACAMVLLGSAAHSHISGQRAQFGAGHAFETAPAAIPFPDRVTWPHMILSACLPYSAVTSIALLLTFDCGRTGALHRFSVIVFGVGAVLALFVLLMIKESS